MTITVSPPPEADPRWAGFSRVIQGYRQVSDFNGSAGVTGRYLAKGSISDKSK